MKNLAPIGIALVSIIALASLISASISIVTAYRSSGEINSLNAPAKLQIVREIVKTKVELSRGLNYPEFHQQLIELETDVTVAKLAHSLPEQDLQFLTTLLARFGAGDSLWHLANDQDGVCKAMPGVEIAFVKDVAGCWNAAAPLLRQMGDRWSGYAEGNAKNGTLLRNQIMQPALDGTGHAMDEAIVALVH